MFASDAPRSPSEPEEIGAARAQAVARSADLEPTGANGQALDDEAATLIQSMLRRSSAAANAKRAILAATSIQASWRARNTHVLRVGGGRTDALPPDQTCGRSVSRRGARVKSRRPCLTPAAPTSRRSLLSAGRVLTLQADAATRVQATVRGRPVRAEGAGDQPDRELPLRPTISIGRGASCLALTGPSMEGAVSAAAAAMAVEVPPFRLDILGQGAASVQATDDQYRPQRHLQRADGSQPGQRCGSGCG